MPTPVSTINIVEQIGLESSPGAGGNANKKLQSLNIEFTDELNVKQFAAMGHRFDTVTAQEQAWSSFALTGEALYTELLYCLENLFGASPVTARGLLTQERAYNPLLTGNITPKTWVTQFGDPADDVKIAAYGLLNDFGLKYDRAAGVTPSGAGISQIISNGGTFTASPTTLALQPMLGAHLNYYLDTTGAAIGTTQITDEILMGEWSVKGIKKARWAANRANTSYAGHVDVKPTGEVKIMLAENATTRAIVTNLRAAQTYFLRIDALGPIIDNLQTLTITGTPSGGTFTVTYKGQTTAGVAFNASAATLQTALQGLSTIGAGNIAVTGSAGGPYTLSFIGTLATDTTLATTSGAGLTGGSSPATAIVANVYNYLLDTDIAFRLLKIGKYSDSNGVYAREITGVIVEDTTWGAAMKFLSRTKEATL